MPGLRGCFASLLLPQYVSVHSSRSFLSSGKAKSPVVVDWLLSLPLTCYLQSQLHFLHLHTLILAYANVWVFDFCNFSALITCVFARWEEPLHLYLKLEGVQAKTSANNYLPVVLWKQKISLPSASCPLFIFPVVLHKQILFIFHSILCASSLHYFLIESEIISELIFRC